MSDLVTLSELFKNRILRVPDYQRGFAWTKSQLVDFWDDLVNLNESRDHYTGLLSLKKLKDEWKSWDEDRWVIDKRGYHPYYVVDGQQRLTTAIILIHEIVELVQSLEENKDKDLRDIYLDTFNLSDIKSLYIVEKEPPKFINASYKFGYEKDNPSFRFLKHAVFGEKHPGTLDETFYTLNLERAKKFFKHQLQHHYKEYGIDAISELFRKLTLHFKFNVHEIEDDFDVFVAFETMNNRGKKLSYLELLKNRVIYLTTLYSDKELQESERLKLRRAINDSWREVYHQLGRNKSRPLSDNEYLRAHWIMYFRFRRIKGDDYAKYLLGQKFTPRHVFNHQAEADPSFHDDEASETEEDFSSATDQSERLSPNEILDYVQNLKDTSRYWFYTFFPEKNPDFTQEEIEWLKRLNRIGITYFRPLITAALMVEGETSDPRVKLIQTIERFIWIFFRMGGYYSTFRQNYYLLKANDVMKGKMSVEEVTEDILGIIEDSLDNAISGFKNKIDRLYRNASGFYSWQYLKYLLFEYESRFVERTGIQKIEEDYFHKNERDRVSVEHIFPQSPTKWYWRNQFRNYTREEQETLANSLGNLLPLSQSINAGLQNDSFAEKKRPTKEGRIGYFDNSHSAIEVSEHEDWGPEQILERGMKLLSFMEERWRFCFPGEDFKLGLLHLDFMKEEREEKPELPKDEDLEDIDVVPPAIIRVPDYRSFRKRFWMRFIDYVKKQGKGDFLRTEKTRGSNYHDFLRVNDNCHAYVSISSGNKISAALHFYNPEAYQRAYEKKDAFEEVFKDAVDWKASSESAYSKRVLHFIYADYQEEENFEKCFAWMLEHGMKMIEAMKAIGESTLDITDSD